MSGNVTGLHTFTADVGPEALSLLDGNFGPLATALNTLTNFSNYYVDAGSVNALAFNLVGSQILAAYADGLLLEVNCANTTTSTTPTINVNALGAKTITDNFGNALQLGAMVAGGRYFLIYDGANFRLLNPSAFAQRGIPVCKFKAATTGRATTTLSNDPDLVYAIPAAGTYAFDLFLLCNGTTTGTQGFSFNVNYSGTFTAAASNLSALQGTTFTMFVVAVQASPTTGPSSIGTVAVSGSGAIATPYTLKGVITATGAGSLALSWAQASGSANNTNVIAGSYLKVTQLS